MSDNEQSNGRPSTGAEGQSVLANLPRSRPQRSTPRRAAARRIASETTTASKQKASTQRKPRVAKTDAAKDKADKARLHAAEEVPRQGFECEGERVRGPVAPPGGAELVASAAEIFGELAKAGVSAGERLLKDALSRLPLS